MLYLGFTKDNYFETNSNKACKLDDISITRVKEHHNTKCFYFCSCVHLVNIRDSSQHKISRGLGSMPTISIFFPTVLLLIADSPFGFLHVQHHVQDDFQCLKIYSSSSQLYFIFSTLIGASVFNTWKTIKRNKKLQFHTLPWWQAPMRMPFEFLNNDIWKFIPKMPATTPNMATTKVAVVSKSSNWISWFRTLSYNTKYTLQIINSGCIGQYKWYKTLNANPTFISRVSDKFICEAYFQTCFTCQ